MRTRRPDAGFSLAALIFFLTAASIFIAAAVPSYQLQAKRQMEEELIFRGEEYARAIQKYQRKFGVYPSSIDQLVSTNNLRFLRRAYKDPVTGKEFRLITINPDGSVTGSKTFTSNVTQPLFGNTQTFGQQNPQQPSQGGQNPQQQQLQRSQQQVGQPGQQSGFPVGGQQLGFPVAGQQPQLSGLPQQQQQQSQQRGQQPTRQQGGGNPVTGSPIGSGGIIGVASDSDKDSIKVYNKRQKYNEWEFIAILGQTGQNPTQGSNPAGTNPAGNNPNSPNPSGFNPRGINPANPSSSPFGGPAGSPLGPAGGATMPVQNPFGFGGAPQQPPPQPRK
jgi:hypothetical protein